MDGAYVPDEAITEGGTNAFVYSTKGIQCKDTEKVIARNEHKRDVMDYLLSVGDIKGISYEMYFMSCNLDHALYDEINLDKEKKQDYADAFYEKFLDREEKFIEFLNTDVVNGVPGTYPASWKCIKEELHSVERHTNLHVYFTAHPKPDGLF